MGNKNILVVGSDGQIGNYLFKRAGARGLSIFGTYYTTRIDDRVYLDITDRDGTLKFFKSVDPGVIIFPAFNPNVDYCETNPEDTKPVNIDAVPAVLEYCRDEGIKFIYYSTDYIFDGKDGPYSEDAKEEPLSVYGMQKLTVEKMIREALDDYIIARVTWVYGWELLEKNFVVRLVRSLREGKRARIPSDQISNPTYAGNIADLTLNLLEKDYIGVINVADREIMSKFEFAQRVARFHNCDPGLIEPEETKNLNQAAMRPLNAGFLLDKIENLLGKRMSSLEDGLGRMSSEKGII